MRIGIIGAGIGGLAAAIGLRRAGADVTLFERATVIRAGGSGLSIFGNGISALAALGLEEPFRAVTEPTQTLVGGQRRPDGTWLSRTPAAALAQLRIVDRKDLHDLLHATAAGMRVHLGVTAGVAADGTIRWSGAQGPGEERFDLVVGADGINSAVRRVIWGDTGLPRYAGYSAWRGITSEPVDLRGEAGETWGHQHRFGIAPLRDGRVYWFAVASLPEGTTFTDEYAEVERRFAHWHDPIGEIICKTDAAAVFRHDICDLAAPLLCFSKGRIVLLGDAAHAMTPDLGQGGNQALEDAASLAALLAPVAASSAPDDTVLRPILARYDQLRRPRTQAIARQARSVGAMAHVEGRLALWSRNLLLRLAPPALVGRRMLKLQSWQPPLPTA